MVDAGLVVGGSNGINASTHPMIMLLQIAIASYSSCKKLSLQRGDKVLLANIGYDTTAVVVQEWFGCEGAYNFKLFRNLMHSPSGLGRTHWQKEFIEFLCQKIVENTIGSKVVAYSRVKAVVCLVCPNARGKSQHQRVS
jgi:hypothetical protein